MNDHWNIDEFAQPVKRDFKGPYVPAQTEAFQEALRSPCDRTSEAIRRADNGDDHTLDDFDVVEVRSSKEPPDPA